MKHALQVPAAKTAPAQAKPVSAAHGTHAKPAVADNRPIASIQRKLQQTADDSPLMHDTLQLKTSGDAFSGQQPQPVQRVENNTGLPDNLKSGIENLSGYSMDDVKVHYNSAKPAELQAHAYAHGTDIHVAPGQEKHLPHEAWHVVQQKQGRVRPTRQLKEKVPVNDDEGLEKEADEMGSKALQLKAAPGGPTRSGTSRGSDVFQLRQRAASINTWNHQLTARKATAQANQQRLNALINAGLTVQPQPLQKGKTAHFDTLFRNTCESIRDGNIFITALTQTVSCDWTHPHYTDYKLLTRWWSRTPQEALDSQLFFDGTINYPNTAASSDAVAGGLDVQSKFHFVRQGNEPAHSNGTEMRVFFTPNINYTDAMLKSIIVHESQHSLDHHDATQANNFATAPMSDSRNTPRVGDIANRYQTEFRAYWLGDNPNGGSFGSPTRKAKNDRVVDLGLPLDPIGHYDPTVVTTNFKNERQENIFWYLADHSYKWAGTNYFDSPEFRRMVDNFDKPVGGNLLNSSRIEKIFLDTRTAKVQFTAAKKKAAEGDVGDAMNTLKFWRTR
jgi:hypothetical protein